MRGEVVIDTALPMVHLSLLQSERLLEKLGKKGEKPLFSPPALT